MSKIKCKPIPHLTQKDISRFWSKVDKTPGQGPHGECWGWTGDTMTSGYGRITVSKSHLGTHRVGYLFHYGLDPYPMLVCHSCDFKLRVRGEHLWKGTSKDNSDDKVKKGRSAKGDKNGSVIHRECKYGEKNPAAKLTVKQVLLIRKLRAEGHSIDKLGHAFGVHRMTIECIAKRKNWAWLE